jgi:transcriptional regulator with XRE-family HTH domain
MQDEQQNPVKSYRLKAGLKVRELAARWGTSFATLSRIENGTQRVPEKLLPTIAKATGKTPAELRPDLVDRSEELSEILAGEAAQ